MLRIIYSEERAPPPETPEVVLEKDGNSLSVPQQNMSRPIPTKPIKEG